MEGSYLAIGAAETPNAFDPEIFVIGISRVGETVGAEENGIARSKLKTELIVIDAGKKAWGNACDLEDLAFLSTKKEWPGACPRWQSSFRHWKAERGRIE